ncbi:hypothetical protein [Nocardia panacis]|nr:hypothetical protein [Nocardia panacis]
MIVEPADFPSGRADWIFVTGVVSGGPVGVGDAEVWTPAVEMSISRLAC